MACKTLGKLDDAERPDSRPQLLVALELADKLLDGDAGDHAPRGPQQLRRHLGRREDTQAGGAGRRAVADGRALRPVHSSGALSPRIIHRIRHHARPATPLYPRLDRFHRHAGRGGDRTSQRAARPGRQQVLEPREQVQGRRVDLQGWHRGQREEHPRRADARRRRRHRRWAATPTPSSPQRRDRSRRAPPRGRTGCRCPGCGCSI